MRKIENSVKNRKNLYLFVWIVKVNMYIRCEIIKYV